MGFDSKTFERRATHSDPATRLLLLEHFDEIPALADGPISAAEAIRRAPELLRARAGELASRWNSSLTE
jgi:hypothetical protein